MLTQVESHINSQKYNYSASKVLMSEYKMLDEVKIITVDRKHDQDWLALGCEKGKLFVLKNLEKNSFEIDCTHKITNAFGIDLFFLDDLQGHKCDLSVVKWTTGRYSLTSADKTGQINIWSYEENVWRILLCLKTRNEGVKYFNWNKHLDKLLVIYFDNTVSIIRNSEDLVWDKSIKDIKWADWVENDQRIIVVTEVGGIYFFSEEGLILENYKSNSKIWNDTRIPQLSDISYQVYNDESYQLALISKGGILHLVSNNHKHSSEVIGIENCKICFSPSGKFLAVLLPYFSSQLNPNFWEVWIYKVDYNLVYKYSLNFKAEFEALGIFWFDELTRLGVILENKIVQIEFITPFYLPSCLDTIIFNEKDVLKPDNNTVNFQKSDRTYKESCKNVVRIVSSGYIHCAIIEKLAGDLYRINIYLSDGSLVTHKNFKGQLPFDFCLNSTHFIAMSLNYIYIWMFSGKSLAQPHLILDENQDHKMPEDVIAFILDDNTISMIYLRLEKIIKSIGTLNIQSISSKNDKLVIVTERNFLIAFDIEAMCIDSIVILDFEPMLLEINCDSTRALLLDNESTLFIYNFEAKYHSDINTKLYEIPKLYDKIVSSSLIRFENIIFAQWSVDDRKSYIIQTNSFIYICNEDRIQQCLCNSNHYVFDFRGLSCQIIEKESHFKAKFDNIKSQKVQIDHFFDVSYAIEIMELGDNKVFEYIEKMPNNMLWKRLSSSYVRDKNYIIARKCFNKFNELYEIPAEEIEAERFGKSLSYYVNNKDLKCLLSNKCDNSFLLRIFMMNQAWSKAIELAKGMDLSEDISEYIYLNKAVESEINGDWIEAAKYYGLSNTTKKKFEMLCLAKEPIGISKLISQEGIDDNLLKLIGLELIDLKYTKEAIEAFVRLGDQCNLSKACTSESNWQYAINCCRESKSSLLNETMEAFILYLLKRNNLSKAIYLAFAYENIEGFLKNKDQTNECFMRCQALITKHLIQLRFNTVALKKVSMLMLFKISKIINRRMLMFRCDGIENYSKNESRFDELFIDFKRTSEALHLCNLCHKKLYQKHYTEVISLTSEIIKYEDIIDQRVTYSMLALASYLVKDWRVCSIAFIQLEVNMTDIIDKRNLIKLNFEAFRSCDFVKNYSLITKPQQGSLCQLFEFSFYSSHSFYCAASSRPIIPQENGLSNEDFIGSITKECSYCGSLFYFDEISKLKNCPTCHVSF